MNGKPTQNRPPSAHPSFTNPPAPEAISKIIHSRLDAEGLISIPLPRGTPTTQPHVPIRISSDLASHSTRVVVLFAEATQEFGVFAHRVVGGRGGITKGSAVGFVKAVKAQRSSAADRSPPGVVLANPGELWWWPEGGRGLTPTGRHGVPMASAVHYGRYHDEEANGIPGNRTVAEHVRSVFEGVVEEGMVSKTARVDVIAVGDVADAVEAYLNDEEVWGRLGPRMNSLVVLGGYYSSTEFRCEGFRRFMKEVCWHLSRSPHYQFPQAVTNMNPTAGSCVRDPPHALGHSGRWRGRQSQVSHVHLVRLPCLQRG